MTIPISKQLHLLTLMYGWVRQVSAAISVPLMQYPNPLFRQSWKTSLPYLKLQRLAPMAIFKLRWMYRSLKLIRLIPNEGCKKLTVLETFPSHRNRVYTLYSPGSSWQIQSKCSSSLEMISTQTRRALLGSWRITPNKVWISRWYLRIQCISLLETQTHLRSHTAMQ